jgi:hypothetical protein
MNKNDKDIYLMLGYFVLNILAYIAVVWWFTTGLEWIFWVFVSFLAIPIQIFIISILLYAGLSIIERLVKKSKVKEKEYIVCSALNYEGTIFAGIGQSYCIRAILKLNPKPDPDIINNNQGFITSTGRFVDRFEAWDIAKANNQIKYHTDRPPFEVDGKPMLMSIHLYEY